jgi:hypothetical protein
MTLHTHPSLHVLKSKHPSFPTYVPSHGVIVLTFLTCVPVLKLILLTVEILSIDLSSSFRKVIITALSTSEQLLRQGQSLHD